MRRSAAITAVLLALGLAPAPQATAGESPDSTQRVFFRDPDRETAARIADLITRMTSGSVPDRTKARRELEAIGFWAVAPLIDAVQTAEPPIRCASTLVLDVLRDRRAIEPLRSVVLKEGSHPYVAAFAALALGRFADAGAVEPFHVAAKTPKSMEMLKAAVPLALAKIRTPAAKDLLLE